MQDYNGKYIWVIGASSGIGYALALELARRGAILLLSARSREKLENLREQIGDKHHIFPMDIAAHNGVREAIAYIKANLPCIDSIINLSALYEPGRADEMDIDKTRALVDVNLMGAFYLVHEALPLLHAQGHGQLALCGSVAGFRGLPNGQPYSATKAAVINLAESLRIENPSLDIKLINPGFVRTPLTDKNDFKMPMIITPHDAAIAIADGLLMRKFEIHFPKRFTFWLKMLRILPNAIYFKIAQKFVKS